MDKTVKKYGNLLKIGNEAPKLAGKAVPDRSRTLSPAAGIGDADAIRDALNSLYERFGRAIYGYCLQRLRSPEEAEDAVQTTFMNAFRGLKGGTVPQAEQAWLFAIAQNVCFARRSSSWKRSKVETAGDFDVLQEIVPSPNNNNGSVELIGLEDVLAGMPEGQRRAILLREWQGLSYREIGEELELSQSAVETLIFRARRALANGLEHQQPTTRKRAVGEARL